MKRIFMYTENYAVGGSNRYLVEFLNGIPLYYDVVLSSNEGGIFDHEFNGITRAYIYETANVMTLPKIRRIFGLNKRGQDTIKKVSLFLLHDILGRLLLPYFQYYNKAKFKRMLRKLKPELVFSFNGGYPAGLSCLDVVLAANELKIPAIMVVVSTPADVILGENIMYGNINKSITALVVNAEIIGGRFVSTRNFERDKIKVLYNCVPVETGSKSIVSNEFLKKINIVKEHNEVFFGYVGRLEKAKGIYVLLEAFSEAVKEAKNIKLILVGTGTELNNIKRMLPALNLENKVVLSGFYEGDLSEALSAFDVFIFPSLREGLPYSILDSMNAGNIIISTNVGGIPEVIRDGVDGLLTPPSDVANMAEYIKKIARDLPSYKFMGINAKERIKQVYSTDIFKNNVKNLVDDLVSKGNQEG